MENIRFQYYRGDIKATQPVGYVTLAQFINGVVNPKPQVKQLLSDIAAAREAGDEKRKSELKKHLPSFTPAVTVRKSRKIEFITSFTGLLVLDFDKIDYAGEFRDYLFNTYNWIVATWLSASGRGVRGFVRIPIIELKGRDPEAARLEYWDYFYGIATELWQYIGFDESLKNCVLPMFYSHDPDLLYRPDAQIWDIKGEIIHTQASTLPAYHVEPSEYWARRIVKMIETGLSKIHDNGHPQLRALALALGGYVGSGYICEDDAITEIWRRIPTHPYLSKDKHNYQRTAVWAVREGQKQPLNF